MDTKTKEYMTREANICYTLKYSELLERLVQVFGDRATYKDARTIIAETKESRKASRDRGVITIIE